MPHKKSAKKRLRQRDKLTAHNRAWKSRVATAVKAARTAPAEQRETAIRKAVSILDRAAKVGVVKKQTARRRKSRLMAAKAK